MVGLRVSGTGRLAKVFQSVFEFVSGLFLQELDAEPSDEKHDEEDDEDSSEHPIRKAERVEGVEQSVIEEIQGGTFGAAPVGCFHAY